MMQTFRMIRTAHPRGTLLRHAAHALGSAAAALGLVLAFGAHAAPGDGSPGTQGPADSSIPGQTQQPPSDRTADRTSGQASGQASGHVQAPANCTPDTPTDQAILGKSLDEVKTMLQGCPWRIGMQDGRVLPSTRDYRPDRRTLTIENDKVTGVTRG
ncbi:hypothetical protein [Pandoraea nosoerga]|nr:hypothetical protein [Pandoraea nosoerga]